MQHADLAPPAQWIECPLKEYWAVRSFARTAHSFARALRSAALIRSFARSRAHSGALGKDVYVNELSVSISSLRPTDTVGWLKGRIWKKWLKSVKPYAFSHLNRKLVKNFTPKKKNEDSEFSLQTGFQRILTEVNDLAGQHESISEKLADEVAKNVLRLAAELRHERKTVICPWGVLYFLSSFIPL